MLFNVASDYIIFLKFLPLRHPSLDMDEKNSNASVSTEALHNDSKDINFMDSIGR